MEIQSEPKWHQKPVGVIVMLLLFFPVGLYLMWKNKIWSKPIQIIVTLVYAFVTYYQIVAVNEASNATTPATTETVTTAESSEASAESPSIDFIKPSDVIVDDDLVGKKVNVKGVFMALNPWAYLYEEAGSRTFIMVNFKKLGKEDQKRLLTECDGGCEVGFSGTIALEYGNKIIVVDEIL